MAIWTQWMMAMSALRDGFSRERTFLWFAVCVAGMSVRRDNLGVSSVVRALSLTPPCYDSLLNALHSTGIDLAVLRARWSALTLRLFAAQLWRVNGRPVLLADGKKIARSGRKMPAVKHLHQESGNNNKPAFIMGHSTQAISLLVNADRSMLAVPLDQQIHEGVRFTPRDKRTLLDKLVLMLDGLRLPEPCYLVADAYYASGRIIKGLFDGGHHLVTRCKHNAVACHLPVQPKRRRRGRPRIYGKKVNLRDLFAQGFPTDLIDSPLYGERNVKLALSSVDLLWRPAGCLVRFVLVQHPVRGQVVLMSTDLTLAPIDVVRLYGARYKIELGFRQASEVVGSYDYHFWMKPMKPTKRGQGEQYLHRETRAYRDAVRRKLHCYHVHLFCGVVAQGLMHYLSACHGELVWSRFGSWMRTIRRGVPASERVVSTALQNTLDEFLAAGHQCCRMAKFILENQTTMGREDVSVAA